MLAPFGGSRRLRILSAVLGLFWIVLVLIAKVDTTHWVERQAAWLIQGTEAVDPFFGLREFWNHMNADSTSTPALDPRGLSSMSPDSPFGPPLGRDFSGLGPFHSLGLNPNEGFPGPAASHTWFGFDLEKYRTLTPPEPPSRWERFKDWVKPESQPRFAIPHALQPTQFFSGTPAKVLDALRYTVWKALDVGWPALIPSLLSLFGAVIALIAVADSKNAGWLLHPLGWLVFVGLVFAVTGAIAFVFRLFLLLLLKSLGAAAVLVGYFAPAILAINEVGELAFRGREKVAKVVEAVRAP